MNSMWNEGTASVAPVAMSVQRDGTMMDEIPTVATAYLWENGSIMVFDEQGNQIATLQGQATPDRVRAIQRAATTQTRWYGFGENGPAQWR